MRTVTVRKPSSPVMARAFSMAEMIVVMAIIGVVASITIPRYTGFDATRRIELAAGKIVTDLAYAQHLAHLTGTKVTVTFDLGANALRLVGINDPDRPGQAYNVKLGDDPYRIVVESADFGGDTSVIFNIYGQPDSSGSITVQHGTKQRRITVDGETGRTSVLDLDDLIVLSEPEAI